jgi:pimeloyl-ACP methyl ester carboxylesterase
VRQEAVLIININGLERYYETEGEGMPLVFLHGWGGSTKSFEVLYNHFKSDFKVYNIDLPGFGRSMEPEFPWTIEAYKNFLVTFFETLNITEPIIIAHSFGCRVVIKAAKDINYKKLILTGAAGIKPKRKVSYFIKVYTYKFVKWLSFLPLLGSWLEPKVNAYRKKAGSSDYSQASDVMRGVLSKAVNEDLRQYLPYIKAPTLLIWGELDTATPLTDGMLMEKMIKDAGLIVYDGCTHFAYLEQAGKFIAIADHFLKGD